MEKGDDRNGNATSAIIRLGASTGIPTAKIDVWPAHLCILPHSYSSLLLVHSKAELLQYFPQIADQISYYKWDY